MSRLTRSLLAGVLLLLSAAALALWITRRPPLITRILPEADAIVYADLRPVRLAVDLTRSTPTRSPDYQRFIDSTGIVPERDLDQAAFALTRRPDPAGPNGPVAFSEVVTGRFDVPRLERYLGGLASTHDTYAGHTVYTLPVDDTSPTSPLPTHARDLRITVLRPGRLAASNAPTPEQIHSIIDRDSAGLLNTAAPSLLAAYFPQIPRLSTAWGIGQLGLPFAADPAQPASPLALFGLSLPLPAAEPLLLSIRYVGSVHLRVEALAPAPATALQQAGALSTLLGLLHTLGASGEGRLNPALAATLDTLSVSQSPSDPTHVVVTASVPVDALRSLTDAPAHP